MRLVPDSIRNGRNQQNFHIVPVGEFFHLTYEYLYVTLQDRSSCFAREKQEHSLPNGVIRRLAHDNCSR